MIVKYWLMFSALLSLLLFGRYNPSLSFDPTGSYKLDEDTIEKDGETYGYFGEIKVKSLGSSKIVITLFVCRGAPSYNAGTLLDTLEVKGNVPVYIPEDDSTCRITITLKRKKIIVKQVQDDLNLVAALDMEYSLLEPI